MTKEDFIGWKNEPITIEIYKKLEETKQALVDGLAAGQTLSTLADETHGNTSIMIGHIRGLNQLLNINYEDETQEEGEEE